MLSLSFPVAALADTDEKHIILPSAVSLVMVYVANKPAVNPGHRESRRFLREELHAACRAVDRRGWQEVTQGTIYEFSRQSTKTSSLDWIRRSCSSPSSENDAERVLASDGPNGAVSQANSALGTWKANRRPGQLPCLSCRA